jgi:hypothetical protein
VLPVPQKIELADEAIVLGEEINVNFQDVNSVPFLCGVLEEELRPHSIQVTISANPPAESSEHEFTPPEVNPEESYLLQIFDTYCSIDAITEKGLYYGLLTFSQLVGESESGENILPECTILDYPRMAIRGVADDNSRGQVLSVESAKRYIREISRAKNNFFAIYIEDIFEFTNHPQIGVGRGRLTPAEVQEICEYGAQYFVEVFPIFESFQHWDNTLRIPEYEKYGEFPGAFSLNIGDPDIFPLVDDMYADVAGAFPSPYFHIGGDEAFDLGRFRSRDYIAQQGGKGPALAKTLTKLVEMAKARGKSKIIMYHDMVLRDPDSLASLPKDLILMFWDYSAKARNNYPQIQKLRDAGFHVIVSPAMANWGRNFPDIAKSYNNISQIIFAGVKQGALGVLTANWGDNGNEDLHENRFWGAFLSGAIAWNPGHFDLSQFWNGFAHLFYGVPSGSLVRELYETLSVFNSHWMFVYPVRFMPMFWCHPFPAPQPKIHYKKWPDLLTKMESAEELIHRLGDTASRNREHLDYLRLAALLGKVLAKKFATSIEIATTLPNKKVTAEQAAKVESLCNEMVELYQRARASYEDLWLRCAKREMLDRVLQKFDWMVGCYQAKIAETREGARWSNPFVPAQWIYPANAPTKAGSSYYLRTTVTMNFPVNFVQRAHIEVIGNDYATLHVNGQRIGAVSSRMCLSPVPRDTAVQVFDIQAFLEPGENIIAIEGQSFAAGTPAVLAYGEILFGDGRLYRIATDPSWKGHETFDTNWNTKDFDDSTWRPAKSRGTVPHFNSEISRPDFEKGLPSLVNDYFGYTGFLAVSVAVIVGNRFAKIAKPLLAVGIKLFHIDSYLL